MSNMTQLFDASRFQGHVKVQSAGKAAVMTLCGPETGSLRLFSLCLLYTSDAADE